MDIFCRIFGHLATVLDPSKQANMGTTKYSTCLSAFRSMLHFPGSEKGGSICTFHYLLLCCSKLFGFYFPSFVIIIIIIEIDFLK